MKYGMKIGNVTTSNNGMEYGNVNIGIEYWEYGMKYGMKIGNMTISNIGMEYGNVNIGIEYWEYG